MFSIGNLSSGMRSGYTDSSANEARRKIKTLMVERKRKLRIGDLLLRTLVVSLKVLGELDSILTNPYQYTHGLPYKEEVVTDAVQRLVRNGYLSREGRGRRALYRITRKGENRVRERISIFLMGTPSWDGKWRIVIFDIEETQRRTRDRLRYLLWSMGFGRLQRSIWISPFPVRDIFEQFLDESGLSEVVLVIEAEYVGGWGNEELVRRVWDLPKLVERYSAFTKQCAQAERSSRVLREEFERLVVDDPHLPEDLFSLRSTRLRAFRAFHRLLNRES